MAGGGGRAQRATHHLSAWCGRGRSVPPTDHHLDCSSLSRRGAHAAPGPHTKGRHGSGELTPVPRGPLSPVCCSRRPAPMRSLLAPLSGCNASNFPPLPGFPAPLSPNQGLPQEQERLSSVGPSRVCGRSGGSQVTSLLRLRTWHQGRGVDTKCHFQSTGKCWVLV